MSDTRTFLLQESSGALRPELLEDERTSCPVNAHLTPGPGIYFNAFIHVYSPRAGADNPLGQMLMSTESPYHFAHLLQVLKQSL